jgi:hypothetical protein
MCGERGGVVGTIDGRMRCAVVLRGEDDGRLCVGVASLT